MSTKKSQERIILSAPAHVPGVQTLIVDDCEPRAWKAYHETFTTCVALKSGVTAAEWTYRGKSHFAGVGDLMLMEPGEAHANKRDVYSASFRVLMISPATMKRAIAEMGGEPGIHFKIAQTHDPMLFKAFCDLHFSMENEASMLEQQSRFAACLRHLAEQCIEFPLQLASKVYSGSVRKAKDYLCDSFSGNISLEELAKVAGVSKFHLLHAFTKEIGMPPHAFQIQLKLSASRHLLRRGLSLAETAAEVGFSDQSHFTRHFKKSWGVTPKAFADSVGPKAVFFPKHIWK
jgi:AraC-like DNA-binding protein